MQMEQQPSSSIREKLRTLIVVSQENCKSLKKAITADEVVPNHLEHEHVDPVRADLIVAREGRCWCIVDDTCYGHSSSKMRMVPGIRKILEDQDPDTETKSTVMEKVKLRKIFHTAVQRTKLIEVTSKAMNASQQPMRKNAETRSAMVHAMNVECEQDPSLVIPVFAPIPHAPRLLVEIEIDDENKEEKLQKALQKRASSFVDNTDMDSEMRESGTHASDTAQISSAMKLEDHDEDSEDGAGLLEGFGRRPEKRSVMVRKFVRRNKFLKKVFGT